MVKIATLIAAVATILAISASTQAAPADPCDGLRQIVIDELTGIHSANIGKRNELEKRGK